MQRSKLRLSHRFRHTNSFVQNIGACLRELKLTNVSDHYDPVHVVCDFTDEFVPGTTLILGAFFFILTHYKNVHGFSSCAFHLSESLGSIASCHDDNLSLRKSVHFSFAEMNTVDPRVRDLLSNELLKLTIALWWLDSRGLRRRLLLRLLRLLRLLLLGLSLNWLACRRWARRDWLRPRLGTRWLRRNPTCILNRTGILLVQHDPRR
mmetsp:Transcript_53922/g.109985  ORF Transcript_53922/g.109985 Transcript_53922/m.109985 type:complete len:207 (-) Transcript_53922:2-622(-)